jgi:hypothetical protein
MYGSLVQCNIASNQGETCPFSCTETMCDMSANNSLTLYETQFKKFYEQLYAQTQPLYMYKHTSRAATLQYILPRRKLILIPERCKLQGLVTKLGKSVSRNVVGFEQDTRIIPLVNRSFSFFIYTLDEPFETVPWKQLKTNHGACGFRVRKNKLLQTVALVILNSGPCFSQKGLPKTRLQWLRFLEKMTAIMTRWYSELITCTTKDACIIFLLLLSISPRHQP